MKRRIPAKSTFITANAPWNVERSTLEQLPHHSKADCLAYRPMGISGLLSSDRSSNMADTTSSADGKGCWNGSG